MILSPLLSKFYKQKWCLAIFVMLLIGTQLIAQHHTIGHLANDLHHQELNKQKSLPIFADHCDFELLHHASDGAQSTPSFSIVFNDISNVYKLSFFTSIHRQLIEIFYIRGPPLSLS